MSAEANTFLVHHWICRTASKSQWEQMLLSRTLSCH